MILTASKNLWCFPLHRYLWRDASSHAVALLPVRAGHAQCLQHLRYTRSAQCSGRGRQAAQRPHGEGSGPHGGSAGLARPCHEEPSPVQWDSPVTGLLARYSRFGCHIEQVWTKIAKDRESLRTLVEDCFLVLMSDLCGVWAGFVGPALQARFMKSL